MKRRGLLIARNRRDVVIEDESGDSYRGLVRGRKLKPLTGDEVYWHMEDDGTAVVDEIAPRRSILERIDSRGRAEGVAANVSMIAIIVAPRPAADWQLVDRYLVAAESIGARSLLVRNKQDIEDRSLDQRAASCEPLVDLYLACSARTNSGLTQLNESLAGERAVLVGQSGVGKSSLTNALLDSEAQAVGRLTEKKSLGRHTTTASVLHRLPSGGELIDSPGVRRYAPNISDPAQLERGFIEFRHLLGSCRFNDCRHINEPNCAIRREVTAGRIRQERYDSYLALRATLEALK